MTIFSKLTQKETTRKSNTPKVYRHNIDNLKKNEELSYDPTAYNIMHSFSVEWPSLSFDILKNVTEQKTNKEEFPISMKIITGSQTNSNETNHISVLNINNLWGTSISNDYEDAEEYHNEQNDNSDNNSKEPKITKNSIPHKGNVNRIRSCPQFSNIIASWSDSPSVYIWDIKDVLNNSKKDNKSKVKPICEKKVHVNEGYALDWNPITEANLLTGDCKSNIFLWERYSDCGWEVNKTPFYGHKKSIEDIKWSPVESKVFASCSVDKSILIWDVRSKNKPAIRNDNAHIKDVNVISWNKLDTSLLASGSDDCSFKIWDLRNFNSTSMIAHFNWHKKPITSIKWSNDDESVIACSSEDNSISIWDLSMEEDVNRKVVGAKLNQKIPPSLMFIHLGQKEIKEINYHNNIKSLLVSTGINGFNIFKPENL